MQKDLYAANGRRPICMVLPVAGEDPSTCYLALDYKLFRAGVVIYVN